VVSGVCDKVTVENINIKLLQWRTTTTTTTKR